MLECELDHHLQETKVSGELNRKNGKARTAVRIIQVRQFEFGSGRNRNLTFGPKIVSSCQLIITDELGSIVISIYRGMSTLYISNYVDEIYAIDNFATKISNIADRVIPKLNDVTTRLNRSIPLFFYSMNYKVKDNGSVQMRASQSTIYFDELEWLKRLGPYLSF